MKIGILTWLNNENYGTLLQAYALQKVLQKNNYEVEDIDFEPSLTFKVKNNIMNHNSVKTFIDKYKEKKKLSKLGYEELKTKSKNFHKFILNNIKTSKIYRNKKDLCEIKNDYNIFIVGSDQIWSPKFFNPIFYLDFLKDNEYKIAYAPSFGISKINKNRLPKIKKYLKKFKRISVREEDGQKILKELTGNTYPIVLDPTLLLEIDDWMKLISLNNFNERYIICYFLTYSKVYIDKIADFAQKNNLKIKCIVTKSEFYVLPDMFEKVVDIGPQEWLNLIYNASYVATDSYHGFIFSLIFQKNFFVFRRFTDSSRLSENSRIYNLVSLLNCQNIILDEKSNIDNCDNVDFNEISLKIANEREKSLKWLKDAIEGYNE